MRRSDIDNRLTACGEDAEAFRPSTSRVLNSTLQLLPPLHLRRHRLDTQHRLRISPSSSAHHRMHGRIHKHDAWNREVLSITEEEAQVLLPCAAHSLTYISPLPSPHSPPPPSPRRPLRHVLRRRCTTTTLGALYLDILGTGYAGVQQYRWRC